MFSTSGAFLARTKRANHCVCCKELCSRLRPQAREEPFAPRRNGQSVPEANSIGNWHPSSGSLELLSE